MQMQLSCIVYVLEYYRSQASPSGLLRIISVPKGLGYSTRLRRLISSPLADSAEN